MNTVNFFDSVPTEIITLILSHSDLDFRDVFRFGATCHRYREITRDNELWKVKLLTRYPCLQQVANAMNPSPDWLEQCKILHKLSGKVHEIVHCLSVQCHHKEDVAYSHFQPLKELYFSNQLCQALTDSVLMGIINDENHNRDLTLKYYTRKALQYVRRAQLRMDLKDLLALSEDQQSLIEGAILFERWHRLFSPSPQEEVNKQVAEIADQARRKLKAGHPSYQVKSDEAVTMTTKQCYEVLDAINDVLYKEMMFRGNEEDYYNESNSFISLVLTRKLGIPITLCILYKAVARKLGIILRPINFPGHFVLCWNYSSDGFKESDTNLFIDAFKNGRVMSAAEVFIGNGLLAQHGFNYDYLQPCSSRDVFRRMAANVMYIRQRSAHAVQDSNGNLNGVEFQAVLYPEDFETVVACVKGYLQRQMNYTQSLEMLSEVQPKNNIESRAVVIFKEMILDAIDRDRRENAERPKPQPKRRTDNLEVIYSIGMVMKHKRYHYSCVIYGWDPVCRLSVNWQLQMGVHQLPHQDKQPFYNVLVDDTSCRYAAQESLDYIDVPIVISHPEVGKHFQEFTKKCYIPNEELAKLYPDDPAVTLAKVDHLYADLA